MKENLLAERIDISPSGKNPNSGDVCCHLRVGEYPIYRVYDCMYVGVVIFLLPPSGEYLIYGAYDCMYVGVVISSLPPSGRVSIYRATGWVFEVILSLPPSRGVSIYGVIEWMYVLQWRDELSWLGE